MAFVLVVFPVADVAVGLDVMAGFPGETETEFCNTITLIESLPVSYLHVFPFSRRPGTPAALMKNQIPPSLVKKRAGLLRELGEKKRKEYLRGFKGRKLQVVVEGENKGGLHRGLSGNYLQVFFRCAAGLEKRTATVEILKASEKGLEGRVVPER